MSFFWSPGGKERAIISDGSTIMSLCLKSPFTIHCRLRVGLRQMWGDMKKDTAGSSHLIMPRWQTTGCTGDMRETSIERPSGLGGACGLNQLWRTHFVAISPSQKLAPQKRGEWDNHHLGGCSTNHRNSKPWVCQTSLEPRSKPRTGFPAESRMQ